MQRDRLPEWLTGEHQGVTGMLVLAIIYVVLMVIWAVFSLPGSTLAGPNGPRYGIGVQFILFAILGWVLFAGTLGR